MLTLDVAIRSSSLEQLAIDFGRLVEKPPLLMHIGALLYPSEAEDAPAENRHRQSFAMLENTSARAIVSHILMATAKRTPAIGEEDFDLVDRPAATPVAASPASDLGKRIGSLTTAVWCLVAAVTVAAVLL